MIIGLHLTEKPVTSANLCWTETAFRAYWFGWLVVCALNLIFWLASGACLLAVKKHFLEHARGLWTACISGTVPMAMCAVVHLGVFGGLCLIFRFSNQALQAKSTFNLLSPVFTHRFDCSHFGYETLRKALNDWQAFTGDPAIQYAYLFLVLAGAMALCAVLPSVTAEINPRLRACTDDAVSKSLADATSQMFDLLRLSGEIVQRYVVIAIPVVVWHAWRLTHTARRAPVVACWVGMVVLGLLFAVAYAYQQFKAETQGTGPAVFVRKEVMFGTRILIIVACFILPWFQNDILLNWLLSVSTLFVLAGVAFLFGPILSVGVDVTSWLQEYPENKTPRARILVRLVAMLDYLKGEGYSGVAIVAHSQGTMIVIEMLRYLNWKYEDYYDGFRMSLFTLGCPLRQLYAVRFPWLYDWVGLNLKAPPQVEAWTNAYGSGDYIGRNLWMDAPDAFSPKEASLPITPEKNEKRREFCLGSLAHVHYWDWRNLKVAAELDRQIMELQRTKSQCAESIPLT
jgi:hypothetical protein